jgi:hypothetical protein
MKKKLGRPFQKFCRYRHPLSGPNLYVSPDGERHCRACRQRNTALFNGRHPNYRSAKKVPSLEKGFGPERRTDHDERCYS